MLRVEGIGEPTPRDDVRRREGLGSSRVFRMERLAASLRNLARATVAIAVLLLASAASHGVAAAAQLHLNWVDNATNEVGFKIERKIGMTGAFALIAIHPADVTSYDDSGLLAGTTYCYRVGAFNTAGDSAYSNEACGTATVSGQAEPQIITGPGQGGEPRVRGFTATGGPAATSFMAYAPEFTGGVFVTLGQLGGAATIIVGAGPGGGPHVRTFQMNGTDFGVSFMAYSPAFTGGVRVASCDVDGDGQAEIITAPGAGGGPHVRVWKVAGATVSELVGFFAYDPAFAGGVFVGCGDVDGDGRAEVITGPGPGGGPHVRVWKVTGATVGELLGFFAYAPSFVGGVRVTGADVDGNGRAEIVTGAGPGGGPHVRVMRVSGNTVSELVGFFAYDPAFSGGVFVARGILDGLPGADIITGAGAGGGPHVRTFSFSGSVLTAGPSFFAYDPRFAGGVMVAGFQP